MTNPRVRAGCRVRIRHSTPLVAQDLSEILELCGAADVSIADADGDISDDRLDVWIAEARGKDAADPAFLNDAKRRAHRVILVLSGLDTPETLPAHVHVLLEPFRTEDVHAVLRDAGLFHHT